jgi:hypothetical protein
VWGSLLVVALVIGSVLGLVAWFSVLVVALVVGSDLGIVAWFSVLLIALVVGSVLGLLAWFSVWHVNQQDWTQTEPYDLIVLSMGVGSGALSPPLGAPMTCHHDRDPSHATTSRGVDGSGAIGVASAPALTEGGRAAFTRRDVLRCGAATGCLLGSIAAATAAITPADADVLRSPGRCTNVKGGGLRRAVRW